MCKHMAKKFCKEWTKKRKFIKKMRLRKMSNMHLFPAIGITSRGEISSLQWLKSKLKHSLDLK